MFVSWVSRAAIPLGDSARLAWIGLPLLHSNLGSNYRSVVVIVSGWRPFDQHLDCLADLARMRRFASSEFA